MSDKPPFDPSAPFSTSAPGDKPAFNPNAAFSTSPPTSAADLPDVGEPAIGAGGEFSPGVPAVNAAADVLARSANKNIIEPIKHPIDTAIGAGKVGLGVAQYVGLPGTGFEPYADEMARDYAKTYGSLEGFKKAATEDPVRLAMDASMGLGVLGKIGRAGSAARTAAIEVPSTAQLFDAAEDAYSRMRGYGVEIHPKAASEIATNARTELEAAGYDDFVAPKTYRALEKFDNLPGQNATISNIDNIRKVLNRVAADPLERDAARRAVGHIDDFVANLDPNDVVVNPHFAPHVAEAAAEARGNYAAAKRAEAIEGATDRASLQAASTGSGANIDNATRQAIKTILTSPKLSRGFSAAEKEQMRQIVAGTFTGNAARLVGKLAPTGIVSGGLSAGLGHLVGHTIGVPVLGAAAKAVGDMTTKRAAMRLSEQVRLRSPLARQSGATPSPALAPLAPRIARRYLLGSQEGRMLNPNPETP